MKELVLNNTPIRTSRNFNINNIKLKDVNIPENITEFKNVKISCNSSKIIIDKNVSDINLEYGMSEELINQTKNNSNSKIKIEISSLIEKEVVIEYDFDDKSDKLVSNIEIIANENTRSTVIFKFNSKENIKGYNNSVIRVFAKNNSNIKVLIINNLNTNIDNYITIENRVCDNAKLDYIIIDFGGKNSITNLYSNLIGKNADNSINTIYFGSENQTFDLNYIAHLKGEKSNVNIEVQGALKDNAKKNFKGTIDFKKGAKKASGNENEACMLLSNTAKSKSLPMLLCSEEDVEGNHSSSAGKIGEKELFYIMSRGFELKEALKLMVRAKFNKIIENIKNEELREEILTQIDKKLD